MTKRKEKNERELRSRGIIKGTKRDPELRTYKRHDEQHVFRVWKDIKGRVHREKVMKKPPKSKTPKTKKKEPSFEKKYRDAVEKNKKRLMRRKLSPQVRNVMGASVLEQEEWGGGIDFESGTPKEERVLLTRGRHEPDASGKDLAAYAPADEREDFELLFHAHPSGKRWGWGPSARDISITSLTKPELVIQKEPIVNTDGKLRHMTTRFYLVRSIHDTPQSEAEIARRKEVASEQAKKEANNALFKRGLDKKRASGKLSDADHWNAWLYEYYKAIRPHLKKELNEIGLDVKIIDPTKEKIYIRADKQKEKARYILVFRHRNRRLSDKNKRKLRPPAKKPPSF